jgi:hypothetical protein
MTPARNSSLCLFLILIIFFRVIIPFLCIAEEDHWLVLEKQGAVIDHIEINITDVFNLEDPNENHFIGHTANFIHITSRKQSISSALLFNEKDAVNSIKINATERLLRSMPYVRDAEIVPVVDSMGLVIARVNIHDAWSLKLGSSFRHVGGDDEWSVRLEEMNVLGRGKQIHLSHEKTIDRTLNEIWYADPFLFNTRFKFLGEYQQLSDGDCRLLKLNTPFYDISTPWSAGIEVNRQKNTETFFEQGKAFYSYPTQHYSFSLYNQYLIWKKGDSAQRLGGEFRIIHRDYGNLALNSDVTSLPFDFSKKQFIGILGNWEFFQDGYRRFQNVNMVHRIEDFNLGWDIFVEVGYFPESFGSLTSAFYHAGSIQKGIAIDGYNHFLWSTTWQGRKEGQHWRNLLSETDMSLFNQRFRYQTMLISLQTILEHQIDPENVLHLGGVDGLRGYINYFRTGDARWLLTLEDRVITPWTFWGLVQLGFVGYIDMGAARELCCNRWSRTYASIGAGLRLGNLKSSFGRVFNFTVAFPLVKEQGVKMIQIIVGEVNQSNPNYSIGP